MMGTFGPSEVHALPVRRCRRAAWQTLVATINGVIFLLLLFSFFWFGYFSPRRGGGGSEICLGVQSYSFGNSGPHAKIQNPRSTPSGRKVKSQRKSSLPVSAHTRTLHSQDFSIKVLAISENSDHFSFFTPQFFV